MVRGLSLKEQGEVLTDGVVELGEIFEDGVHQGVDLELICHSPELEEVLRWSLNLASVDETNLRGGENECKEGQEAEGGGTASLKRSKGVLITMRISPLRVSFMPLVKSAMR